MNAGLTEQMLSLAKENEIKHQIEVIAGGSSGTNARVIQMTRSGVATAVLEIPLKYMHSTIEVISLDDVECTAWLLCEIAKGLSDCAEGIPGLRI